MQIDFFSATKSRACSFAGAGVCPGGLPLHVHNCYAFCSFQPPGDAGVFLPSREVMVIQPIKRAGPDGSALSGHTWQVTQRKTVTEILTRPCCTSIVGGEFLPQLFKSFDEVINCPHPHPFPMTQESIHRSQERLFSCMS